MTLDAFIALTENTTARRIRVCDARPMGGWSAPIDFGHTRSFAESLVEDGNATSVEEALEQVLETSIVLAVNIDGHILGAWSATAWFLGTVSWGKAISSDAVEEVAKHIVGY